MRPLFVSHAFPPESLGGVEICTASLATTLRQRGHDVHVLCRINREDRPEYETSERVWQGLPVTTLNNTFRQTSSFEMTYRNQAIERAFSIYLDRLKPDLVHFEHLTCLSTGLVEAARRRGLPTLLTIHDYWLVCQRGQMLQPDLALCTEPEDAKCARCLAPYIYPYLEPSPLASLLAKPSTPSALQRLGHAMRRISARARTENEYRLATEKVRQRTRHVHEVMRQADLLLAPSRFHRSQFVRFGVDPDRIQVQYNGLRVEPFQNRERVPAPQTRFCFLGSVIPSKGVHLLLEAFRQLGDVPATLDVYGGAPPYEGFPHYARNLEAKAGPRVQFHGRYDNARVADILARTDVVVVPSIWCENAPVTIQEAHLAGVPVIGSRIGGIPEFVHHEVNGLLFQPRNVEDLRAQMQRLLAEPHLRRRLACHRTPVKTIEEQATELEAIYAKMLRTPAGATR
jgi:glycosyltransferase involved in cell wall biosynthesis